MRVVWTNKLLKYDGVPAIGVLHTDAMAVLVYIVAVRWSGIGIFTTSTKLESIEKTVKVEGETTKVPPLKL